MVSRARRHGREIDAATVRQVLTQSAKPSAVAGFNYETGAGLLDAPAALRRLDDLLSTQGG